MTSTDAGNALTFRAQWARLLVREQLAREVNILQSSQSDGGGFKGPPDGLHQLPLPGQTPWTPDKLPKRSEVLRDHEPPQGEPKKYKLCIVGAGMAGLYIALILDTLKIDHVSFDFFEASDRIGGRCFTYEFSNIPHDYYDVWAMRFPEINVMKRQATGFTLPTWYLT
jgi:NADPH-dependent 2,4-dienoyl-CoA reductase/sulfur reductase-like enzyme